MDIYATATVLTSLLAGYWAWRQPGKAFIYVFFILGFLPLTYRQLIVDHERNIALATLTVASVVSLAAWKQRTRTKVN